jgi:hypothetical protein
MGEIPLAMLLIAALYWLAQTAINWVCSPTTNCTIVNSKLELRYAAGFDLPGPAASFLPAFFRKSKQPYNHPAWLSTDFARIWQSRFSLFRNRGYISPVTFTGIRSPYSCIFRWRRLGACQQGSRRKCGPPPETPAQTTSAHEQTWRLESSCISPGPRKIGDRDAAVGRKHACDLIDSPDSPRAIGDVVNRQAGND